MLTLHMSHSQYLRLDLKDARVYALYSFRVFVNYYRARHFSNFLSSASLNCSLCYPSPDPNVFLLAPAPRYQRLCTLLSKTLHLATIASALCWNRLHSSLLLLRVFNSISTGSHSRHLGSLLPPLRIHTAILLRLVIKPLQNQAHTFYQLRP